jgi:hypothetical protein
MAVTETGELLGYSHGKETIPLKSGSTSPFPQERHAVIIYKLGTAIETSKVRALIEPQACNDK